MALAALHLLVAGMPDMNQNKGYDKPVKSEKNANKYGLKLPIKYGNGAMDVMFALNRGGKDYQIIRNEKNKQNATAKCSPISPYNYVSFLIRKKTEIIYIFSLMPNGEFSKIKIFKTNDDTNKACTF